MLEYILIENWTNIYVSSCVKCYRRKRDPFVNVMANSSIKLKIDTIKRGVYLIITGFFFYVDEAMFDNVV